MESEVKIEPEVDEICQGCLSRDRNTYPLGEHVIMYNLLLGNVTFDQIGTIMPKMCWECMAKLKSFKHFRHQLYQAQNSLMNIYYKMDTVTPSLSPLKITTKHSYDYVYDHDIITNITDDKHNDNNLQMELDIKIEKVNDITMLQYNKLEDHNDNDNELLPDLYSSCVKEEAINGKKQIKKVKKRPIQRNTRTNMNYCKYAIVKKEADIDVDSKNIDQYFDHVCLNENEVEELVHKKEREANEKFLYKCDTCKLEFLTNIDYKRHDSLLHYEPNKKPKCVICNKNLPSFESLKQHWKKTHTQYYICKLCNEYCRKNCKMQHIKFRHCRKIYCTGCKLDFPTMTLFRLHYKNEHDKYICDYCNKICYQKQVLIRHIEHKHFNHSCKMCCKNFKSYRSYYSHMLQFHPELLKKDVDKEATYCVECNRHFPSVVRFKKHLRDSVKHGFVRRAVRVPCPECGKIFKRNEYMKNHLYHVHMPEKSKYYCNICNKYYANNWILKNHNLNVHLKVPKKKDKICDLCGRGFHTNRILINHRRTHTGERPYQCSFCSASFAQRTAMMTHQKTQHRDMRR